MNKQTAPNTAHTTRRQWMVCVPFCLGCSVPSVYINFKRNNKKENKNSARHVRGTCSLLYMPYTVSPKAGAILVAREYQSARLSYGIDTPVHLEMHLHARC